MTTRTSKHPAQNPSQPFAPQVGHPNLPTIMVISALLVGLGWLAINSGQVAGNLPQIIIITLLLMAALSPSSMGLLSGLFRRASVFWLTRNGFAGYGNSLDVAATINLLLLLPENLEASNLQLRLTQLHKYAVKTIFVSPEPAVNVTSIAAAMGADNFVAAITPNSLLCFVEKSRANGLQVALGVTNEAYTPVLQHVDMPITGRNALASLPKTGVVDTNCADPRPVDLLELGQRWRITKQVIWNVAVVSDLLKWIVVIPALFSMPVGLSGLQLTNLLSAVTAALIFSGLTVLVCVPMVFFGTPDYFINCKKPLLACSLVTGFIGLVTIKIVEMLLIMWGPG